MSTISTKIKADVSDLSVSNHYGRWGALNPDQRAEIRTLCDTCDMFEKIADEYYKENQALKAEIKLLKEGNKQ